MSFADFESGTSYKSYNAGGRSGDRDAEYIRCNEEITANLIQMTNKVNTLQKAVNQLGTSKDNADLRARVNRITEDCRKIARDTQMSIKRLCTLEGDSGRENQQRRLQQAKLSKDFKSVLSKFQEISKVASQKERQGLAQARQSISPAGASPLDSTAQKDEEERQGLLEAQRLQMLQVENEANLNASIIAEREEGIREIEGSIMEVNEIFKDLSTLVTHQGDILDNIESNIIKTVDQTEGAVTHLKKARELQKGARKKWCFLIILLTVVMIVAAIFIYIAIK